MSKQIEIINVNQNVDYLPSFGILMVDEYTTADVLKMNPKTTKWVNETSRKIIPWGYQDRFPEETDQLIYNDPDARLIIKDIVNFLLGQGLEPYRRVVKNGVQSIEVVTDKKVWDWYDENESHIMEQLRLTATNFVMYGNYYCEYLHDLQGRIRQMLNIDCHYMRPFEINSGELWTEKYAVYTKFSKGFKRDYETVPNFKNKDLTRKGFKYIYQGKDAVPGNPYFGVPVWLGARRNMQLTQMVISGQIAALDNGWNIKYKMSVHESYYADCGEDELLKKAKKTALVRELNSVLAGIDNNNKVLVIDMVGDYAAKNFNDMVKIEVIDNNKENATHAKLLESKMLGAPRSFGLDPELSGINIGGNLSSGSEIRNKYHLHIALKTPIPRQIILEPLRHIMNSYGWNDVKWRVRDLVLVKLDEDKSGIVEQ